MASTLIELKHSGRPNRSTTLDPVASDRFWAMLNALPASIVPADLCWKCLPMGALAATDLLLTRTEGREVEWAFVIGNLAITRRGSHSDIGALRTLISPILLSMPAVASGVVALEKPSTKAAKADGRRCDHAASYHVGDFTACGCGSPVDAARWLPMEICEASNCYNYAVGDVWCRIRGLSVGATPVRMPTVMDDYAEWTTILGPDGLIPVPDHTTVPAGATGGWHVALAVDATDFHFLRLDGAQWSHKFGPRPPQTCDGAGAVIPANDLARANLCGYRLVGYFYVPQPLEINH